MHNDQSRKEIPLLPGRPSLPAFPVGRFAAPGKSRGQVAPNRRQPNRRTNQRGMEDGRNYSRTNTKRKMSIEFHVQTSETTRQYWSFYANGAKLILNTFQEQEKPKGKRVWRMVQGYARLRVNGMMSRMKISEFPFSTEIAERAKAEFIKSITVEFENV